MASVFRQSLPRIWHSESITAVFCHFRTVCPAKDVPQSHSAPQSQQLAEQPFPAQQPFNAPQPWHATVGHRDDWGVAELSSAYTLLFALLNSHDGQKTLSLPPPPLRKRKLALFSCPEIVIKYIPSKLISCVFTCGVPTLF